MRATAIAQRFIERLPTSAPSSSLAAAETKAKDFYREVCRHAPVALRTYKLGGVTTTPKMRRVIADMFRENKNVKDKSIIDILILKGREELQIDTFVARPIVKEQKQRQLKEMKVTPFLANFYRNKPMF